MLVRRISPLSGPHTMDLPVTQEQLDRYYSGGGLIQDVFPDLTKAQREFLMTGYTEEDWARMFPPGSDE